MRDVIHKLSDMGPLPALDPSDPTLDARLDHYAALLHSIERPVTDEEARALLSLFGPDDAGELVWMIIHLVETAPAWPMKAHLERLPESP